MKPGSGNTGIKKDCKSLNDGDLYKILWSSTAGKSLVNSLRGISYFD